MNKCTMHDWKEEPGEGRWGCSVCNVTGHTVAVSGRANDVDWDGEGIEVTVGDCEYCGKPVGELDQYDGPQGALSCSEACCDKMEWELWESDYEADQLISEGSAKQGGNY